MYFAHLDGQEEEVVRAFDQSLASIDPVALQGGLIERLVAVSARDLLLEEVRRELVEAPLSLSSMQRLATLMDSTVLPPIALTVEVERLVVLDVIARVYTDDGRGNGMLIPHLVGELGEQQDSFLESVLANNRTMGRAFITHFFMHERFPSKRETTDRCHRYFDRMARWLSLTPSQRDQDDGNPGDILEEARTQYDLAMGISVAPLDRLSGVLLKTRTRESATRAMLAIEMYRAERGDLPDSLGNLVPKYLREIPLDAYAEPEPLRYSRKAGGYLLYSVGADRKDDGGTPPSDPNEAYLPRTVRGVDAVFSDVKK